MNTPPAVPSAYTLVTLESAGDALAEARRLARSGAGEGTLVWVREQTDGCGRLGRSWRSAPGNLHCAVLLRPELDPVASAQLGLVALVSLGNALSSLLSPLVLLRYRWPNKLLLNADTAAGIWMDGDFDAHGPASWLTIGLSVNIAWYPDNPNPGAVSVHEVQADSDITAELVLEAYTRQLLHWFDRWSEEGLAPVLKRWKQRADGVGDSVSVALTKGCVHGELSEVDDTGRAIVIEPDGSTRPVSLVEFFDLGQRGTSRPTRQQNRR